MSNPITLETGAELLSETKPSPAWQAAWRFARQLLPHGFIPRTHFIDRISERALGGGIRFDASHLFAPSSIAPSITGKLAPDTIRASLSCATCRSSTRLAASVAIASF